MNPRAFIPRPGIILGLAGAALIVLVACTTSEPPRVGTCYGSLGGKACGAVAWPDV